MSSMSILGAAKAREATVLSISVVLVLGALHIHGLMQIPVGPVDVTPWNVAGVAVVCIAFMAVLTGGMSYRWSALMAGPVVAYVVLTLWMGLSSVHSWQPWAAAAVAAVQLVNTLLLVSLASMQVDRGGLERVNSAVFVLGTLASIVALALFAGPLLAYPNIPQREGLGYVLDRGIALRLKGLTTDPNLFALYLSIPFLIGLSQRGLPYRILGTVAMGAAIGLSLSRTMVVAVGASVALAVVAAAFVKAADLRAYARAATPALVLAAAVLVALVVWIEPLQEFVLGRLESVTTQSRIPKWAQAWALLDNPLMGEGLRSMDDVLGHFSHSTWLDMMIETGIIGLVMWVTFLSTTLVTSRRLVGSADALPWIQGLVVAVLAASTFSLAYSPLFPLIAGVLVARREGARSAGGRAVTPASDPSTSSSPLPET